MARKSRSSYKPRTDKFNEKMSELKKKIDLAYRISRDKAVNKTLEEALALLKDLS